jgi:hypothetical protein
MGELLYFKNCKERKKAEELKQMLAGSVLCSHAIRYAKYIRRRKSSFRKMGY